MPIVRHARQVLVAALLALAGCGELVIMQPGPEPGGPVQAPAPQAPPSGVDASRARTFQAVVNRVMPIAQQECRTRTRGVRCDYAVVVDDRPGLPPNAFQTLGPGGQPVVGFTLPLIQTAANADEMAFVLGHEAAHHIEGHIARGQASAATGAVLAGALATLGGGDAVTIQRAQNLGAFYGSRRFSKDFELEADALGTIITQRAGYDPVRGVAYFNRVPDPGNRFLGTHPPNADRIALVRRVAAGQ
ncbi:M48 family metallopeptidase [Palleronia pelagia]|uniref:Peptidase family M48 n=1 Tax=Palleronia pelagia TaxID=387096 RepID=A0A1H8JHW7_9RHOB|nr:M48 family metallopeptidase [Palleronia pelagia]SEN80404.1 Peptidase family M48 [Palleronia pelagia]